MVEAAQVTIMQDLQEDLVVEEVELDLELQKVVTQEILLQ